MSTKRGEAHAAFHCPPDFIGCAMLAMIGGAIGNTRRARIKQSHRQPAVLFVALVGEPGDGKSPMLSWLLRPFVREDMARKQCHAEAVEHWERVESDARGPRPRMARGLIDNITAESMAAVLGDNRRGVLHVKDELRALFLAMNQYKGGKGSDRQALLSLWSCTTTIIDRVSDRDRGGAPNIVPEPFACIVGGIQPDVLASMSEPGRGGRIVSNDGMVDRFLYSAPASLPAVGETWDEMSIADELLWEGIVGALLSWRMDGGESGDRPRDVPLSESGAASWKAFTDANAAESNGPDFPPHLRSAWKKMPAHLARLAVVLHAAKLACGGDGESIDATTINAAWRLVKYFKGHCRRVRHLMDADPAIANARHVLGWITRRGADGGPFSKRDLFEGVKGTFQRADALDAPLAVLGKHHAIRPVDASVRPGPGRKPSGLYEANPALWADSVE